MQAEASSPGTRQFDFVTPDFCLKADAGRQLPFRLLLSVRYYGENPAPNCMWSPSCVMEGTANFQGKATKLILFTSDFSGNFDRFGRAAYSLRADLPKSGEYVSRQTLSSLINHEGKFYRFDLQGSCGRGMSLRVVLTESTAPVGELAVSVKGNGDLRACVSSLSFVGTQDKTVFLRSNRPSPSCPPAPTNSPEVI